MRRFVIIALFAGFATWICPQPEVEAFDPVTLSLLAPVALKGAQIAAPYVIKGLKNAGRAALYAGKDMMNIFLLPAGLLEATIGAPFGYFIKGVRHTATGMIAPFKLCFHTILIPVAMFGVGIPF